MEYRVLARKYRPSTFADLIGQEALVRTLSNAINTGRLAHAFLLTGIRGVGKTTTARIIAMALNCEKGPTIDPCGVCSNCKAIAESRHVDVLEMDAASRTGVGDIRDIIDTVHYAPVAARNKIYIIDEVHMLSGSAFNALLKTLEEPPPSVKFIFATTEARKIPVTILSRCQRFDLKRIGLEVLAAHLSGVAEKEGMKLSPEAARLLAQSAEGSARDGLSLLDQAIAMATTPGEPIGEAVVRTMLGLADKGRVLSLLAQVFEGKAQQAVQELRALYHAGADPLLVLQDMLEFTHFITRIKIGAGTEDATYGEHERNTAAALAGQLSMPVLARMWQMLLKAVGEVRYAPSPLTAAEMALVRAAYAAELPTPAEAIRGLQGAPAALPAEKKTPEPAVPLIQKEIQPVKQAAPVLTAVGSYPELVDLLAREKEPLLAGQLRQFGSLVSFAPGLLEVFMKTPVPREFSGRVTQVLNRATGMEWKIVLSSKPGAPTLDEEAAAARSQAIGEATKEKLVASVFEHFPGAEVVNVK